MSETLRCISPVDGSLYLERSLAGDGEIEAALEASRAAQRAWRAVALEERQALLTQAVDAFVTQADAVAEEITWQMGRPIAQSPGEVAGFEERARHMIAIAPEALAPLAAGDKAGFTRYIKREPLGLVFVMAPWNYPYLTAVNSIVPALHRG